MLLDLHVGEALRVLESEKRLVSSPNRLWRLIYCTHGRRAVTAEDDCSHGEWPLDSGEKKWEKKKRETLVKRSGCHRIVSRLRSLFFLWLPTRKTFIVSGTGKKGICCARALPLFSKVFQIHFFFVYVFLIISRNYLIPHTQFTYRTFAQLCDLPLTTQRDSSIRGMRHGCRLTRSIKGEPPSLYIARVIFPSYFLLHRDFPTCRSRGYSEISLEHVQWPHPVRLQTNGRLLLFSIFEKYAVEKWNQNLNQNVWLSVETISTVVTCRAEWNFFFKKARYGETIVSAAAIIKP